MDTNFLSKEDYEEPACPFCTDQYGDKPPVKGIPRSRVTEKLDSYLAKNDYEGAEKHLLYWLEEARIGHDDQGMFLIYNELMGLYRKLGKEKEAIEYAENALMLSDYLDYSDSVSGATAYINAATVYKAFGRAKKSIPLFLKAKAIYESKLLENDGRLGGLYNNTALAYGDLGEFEEAEKYYLKALEVMKKVENGEPEQAITYLNLADLEYARNGDPESEIIKSYLAAAEELLNTPSVPRDGYYAFVCEKCAPAFTDHGNKKFGKELIERAKTIYERS